MIALIGYALIALIVAGVLFYAAVALLPAGLSLKSESDRRPFELPGGRPIERRDLESVRIPVAIRGYRFAETDDLIDRLTAEITMRDEEIARLQAASETVEREAPDVGLSAAPEPFEAPAADYWRDPNAAADPNASSETNASAEPVAERETVASAEPVAEGESDN